MKKPTKLNSPHHTRLHYTTLVITHTTHKIHINIGLRHTKNGTLTDGGFILHMPVFITTGLILLR